jgi:glycolate oxidase iron-sulfur subunit
MMDFPVPDKRFQNAEYQGLLDQCIHCGLCLQACPTYAVFGTEMDSPRGRISLIRAAAQGRIGLDGPFQTHINLCLSCRACETACPSGVQYGSLVEVARISMEQARHPGRLERFIRWLALRQLMPHVDRLKLIAWFARCYQVLGLPRLFRALTFLPNRLKTMEGLLPPMPAHYSDYRQPARALGPKRGIVAFFYGCMQEAFLADVNAATVRVLQENGYDVHFPAQQTCCGAAQLHLGEEELSRELARKNIDAFLGGPSTGGQYQAIINNAGGCGEVLKEYAHILKDDPGYAEKARLFVSRVKDISEFLVENGYIHPAGELRAKVTYSDSCHLRHAQKVVRQPREILSSIPGIELVELSRPDACCGSAGVYNITQTDTANAILDLKMQDIQATGADVIVATNTGCYFQLVNGVKRSHSSARVVHLVELLDQSYQVARALPQQEGPGNTSGGQNAE